MFTFKHKRKYVKTVAVLLCAIVTVGVFSSSTSQVQAETIASLQEKIESYKQKQAQAEEKIASLQDDINNEQEIQKNLNVQISAIKDELSAYQQQIDLVNQQISQKQADIDAKNAEIDSLNAQIEQKQEEMEKTDEQFMQRLKAMYMQGETTTLGLLFGADSFSDFLTQAQVVKSVSESDAALMQLLADQKLEIEELKTKVQSALDELEAQKTELEQDKADLVTIKSSFDSQNSELTSLLAKSNANESALQESQDNLNVSLSEYNEGIKQAQAQIDAIIAANEAKRNSSGNTNNTPPSGQTSSSGYIWPVAGGYVSSYFGARWGTYHKGIDIAAPYGTNIYASKAGTVLVSFKGYSGSGYGGYGNVVLLDHWDGTYTLYAHCSLRLVSVGETVSQGQVIAKVGSTGQSTGNHCHFEIRQGTTYLNPLNYVSP